MVTRDVINLFGALAFLAIVVTHGQGFGQAVKDAAGAAGGLFKNVAYGQ